jgi:DNA-binding MarR family transcriptional regulator
MNAPSTAVHIIMNSGLKENRNTAQFAPVRAIMALSREFDKIARDYDFSITLYRFMLYLMDGPKRAGEVAATSLVTKATISQHIAALREKGWITVETEALDRRVTRLVLTDSGRDAMESFETRLLECLGTLVNDNDRSRILKILADVYWALSATRETRYLDFETPEYKFLPPSGAK